MMTSKDRKWSHTSETPWCFERWYLTSSKSSTNWSQTRDGRLFCAITNWLTKLQHQFSCLRQDNLMHGLAVWNLRLLTSFHLSGLVRLNPTHERSQQYKQQHWSERVTRRLQGKVIDWGLWPASDLDQIRNSQKIRQQESSVGYHGHIDEDLSSPTAIWWATHTEHSKDDPDHHMIANDRSAVQ